MKKSIYYLFQSLILLVVITSCSTDDTEIDTNPILLKKAITRSSTGALSSTINYTYNANKLVTITVLDKNDVFVLKGTFTYDNDVLTKIEEFDGNNTLINYIVPEYNSNNQITEYIEYNETNNTAGRCTFTYNSNNIVTKKYYSGDYNTQTTLVGEKTLEVDANGNIIKVITDTYTIDYSFDDKNGVFENIASANVINLIGRLHVSVLYRGSKNNTLSFEFSNGKIIDHLDFTYEYNSDNFPISLTQNSTLSGEILNTEFQYE